MNIVRLNEEIELNDGNGGSIILALDYKNHRYEIFKTYDDKTFSSNDIQKYFDIISTAVEIGKDKLNPTTEKKQSESNKSVHKLNPISKKCKSCGNDFTAYSNRSVLCPTCKSNQP